MSEARPPGRLHHPPTAATATSETEAVLLAGPAPGSNTACSAGAAPIPSACSAGSAPIPLAHAAKPALMPSAYAARTTLMTSACRPGSSCGLLRRRMNRHELPQAPGPTSARGLQHVPPRVESLRESYLEESDSRQEVDAQTLFGPAELRNSRRSYVSLSKGSYRHGVPDRRSSYQRNTFANRKKRKQRKCNGGGTPEPMEVDAPNC